MYIYIYVALAQTQVASIWLQLAPMITLIVSIGTIWMVFNNKLDSKVSQREFDQNKEDMKQNIMDSEIRNNDQHKEIKLDMKVLKQSQETGLKLQGETNLLLKQVLDKLK